MIEMNIGGIEIAVLPAGYYYQLQQRGLAVRHFGLHPAVNPIALSVQT